MDKHLGRRDFLKMTALGASGVPVVSTLWSAPARANNAATSRSAPLRLFTKSRPATSTGRCVSAGVANPAAPDGPSGLVPPLLAFGVCGADGPGLTTLDVTERSAGTSRATAGGS